MKLGGKLKIKVEELGYIKRILQGIEMKVRGENSMKINSQQVEEWEEKNLPKT